MAVVERTTLSHWGAFVAQVSEGRLTGVRPFPGTVKPSPMLAAWPELVYSPTRISKPAVRTSYLKERKRDGRGDDSFTEVSWDDALDLVAEELLRVREEYGSQSVFGGSHGWSSAGRYHHANTQVRRFLYASGGCTDSISNYSWGAANFILPHVLGDFRSVSEDATDWQTIVDEGELFVAFGGLNPKNWQVTGGGAGEHGMESWVRRAVDRGVQFVVVSPVRDDAPDWLNAEWLAPVPNSDTAIMLGIAHTLINNELYDRGFVRRYCSGFDNFRAYVMGLDDGQPKDARWAASISGISADDIVHLAQRMAASRTMLTASWSIQRGDHGEQPYWALIALAALLGQVGLPGGGFSFGYGSLNGVGAPHDDMLTPVMPRLANPIASTIPVARIADMLLNPGETIEFNGQHLTYPDIHVVYWAGGNPFHHHQDLNRLREAWQRPDTVIVHEPWWTATARHADIVLPATTPMERNDIGGTTRDRYVFAMPQLIEPVASARNDEAIFRALAERLDCVPTYTENRSEMEWVHYIYADLREKAAKANIETPTFDEFWRTGYWQAPKPNHSQVLLSDFRLNPDRHALRTPSGRIELYSEVIAGFNYADCPPQPTWIEPAEWLGGPLAARFPLHLLSIQPRTRLHSQMDQTTVGQDGKIAGREPIMIHPTNAASRGIGQGDLVRVFNDRGACLAAAHVTDRIRPDVVIMATGAWYNPDSSASGRSLDKHGNPNVLTKDRGTSRLAQAVAAQSVLVEIEKYEGSGLGVSAFDPPTARE